MKKSIDNSNKKIKNYLILILLFIVSIGFVLYVCEIYRINEEEAKKIPIIDGLVYEIYSEDLEHYILDNPTSVVYICTANSDDCRLFERDFKKLLKKEDYSSQLVYLNLTDINQDEFINNFNNKYKYKIALNKNYPAFVLFEDGKVKSILQGREDKPLKITAVEQFLEINEIGE